MAAALPAIAMLQAGTEITKTYGDIQASKAQDRYQRSQAAINQQFLKLQAEDAIRRGDVEAGKVRRESARLTGSQRASFAGQGVDVGSGSPAEVIEESRLLGEQDILTTKGNAWREAWGYRVEASQLAAESRMKTITARKERRNTLITGGMNVLNYGAQAAYYKKGGKNPTEARFDREYKARVRR